RPAPPPLLPSSPVFEHPGLLRPAHGRSPRHRRRLSIRARNTRATRECGSLRGRAIKGFAMSEPRPNPRLQRTRSALLRSPLSRTPLGRVRWSAVVALVALGWTFGCARSHSVSVSTLPTELVVPRGATKVVARSHDGTTALQYEIVAAYPAEAFLTDLESRMKELGWQVMEKDFMNPTIPTSNVRGWTAFIDRRVSPPIAVHQWLGDWQRQNGDVVSYALRYSQVTTDTTREAPPPGTPDLHVSAFLIPAAQAQAMAAEARRLGGK